MKSKRRRLEVAVRSRNEEARPIEVNQGKQNRLGKLSTRSSRRDNSESDVERIELQLVLT